MNHFTNIVGPPEFFEELWRLSVFIQAVSVIGGAIFLYACKVRVGSRRVSPVVLYPLSLVVPYLLAWVKYPFPHIDSPAASSMLFAHFGGYTAGLVLALLLPIAALLAAAYAREQRTG